MTPGGTLQFQNWNVRAEPQYETVTNPEAPTCSLVETTQPQYEMIEWVDTLSQAESTHPQEYEAPTVATTQHLKDLNLEKTPEVCY